MLRDIFYNYISDLLGGLYFRYGIRLIPVAEEEIDSGAVKRLCVLTNSGIDDITMLMQMLKALRGAFDGFDTLRTQPKGLRLLVVVDSEDNKNLLEESLLADKIFVLNDTVKKNKALRQIRKEWIDLTIAINHPSYENAKIAFQTGATYSIGFRYDYKDNKDTDFFFTHPVPFDPRKSKLERYIDLIRPLGLYRLPELDSPRFY